MVVVDIQTVMTERKVSGLILTWMVLYSLLLFLIISENS